MADEEDLFNNPLYVYLVSHIDSFEKRASQESWTILIPQILSLSSLDLSSVGATFTHKYILHTSPFLKNEFLTVYGNNRVKISRNQITSPEVTFLFKLHPHFIKYRARLFEYCLTNLSIQTMVAIKRYALISRSRGLRIRKVVFLRLYLELIIH